MASLGWTQAPETVPARLGRAARQIEAGDWSKAELTLNTVLSAHPNQADALNLMGIAVGKQGRQAEAERFFHRAVESNPSLAAAWINLAQIYKERGAGTRALETLELGLSHAPHDAYLLAETGRLLADRGQYEDAARRLQQIPPAARDTHYWQLLARVRLSAGDYAEAEADLLRVQGKRESVQGLRELAGIALKRQDPARARQYLARALRLAPNSPELLYEYAEVCLQMKLAIEAVAVMRRTVLMEPDRPDYILLLGNALMDTLDYHEAPPLFQRYVHMLPQDPRGHLALGWSLLLEKNFPEAERELQETLRLDPKQADAWYHLGMLAYETNDDDKAVEMLNHALSVDSHYARAHLGLGLVHSRHRRYPEALDEFEASARLDPDEPKVHYQLSQIYARLGDTLRARHELQLYQEAQKKSDERKNVSEQSALVVNSARQRP